MGFNIGKLKTSSEGQWVDCGGGLRIKVARLGNPDYEEEVRKLAKPFMRQMRLGTMNVEDMEKMAQKAVAKHVIQGWENLEDETGNAIAFSSDKALELFQKYPDFYNIVKDVAGEAEIFRTDEMEEAAGNSDGASDGTSTGESTNASS
jgi:recombinational DNA repair protein RecT